MCAYFVDVSALEDVISERVKVTSAWTEGFVSWFEEWESKFAFACWDKYPGW
jgi:general stress protein 26